MGGSCCNQSSVPLDLSHSPACQSALRFSRSHGGNREPQAGLYSILTKDTRNDSNAINLTQKWDTPIGWSQDSENIYAIRRDTIIVIQYDTGIITNYLKISPNNFTFERINPPGSSIAPDGKTFIFSIIENEQFDIWRVTNFDPEFN